MKTRSHLRSESGVALIIALIMLLVMTLIGISAISTTTYEASVVGNEKVYNTAFYTADGGIGYCQGLLRSAEGRDKIQQSFDKDVPLQAKIGDSTFKITVENIWTKGGEEEGYDTVAPITRFYKVVSEGVSPNFPVAGKVQVESIYEVRM